MVGPLVLAVALIAQAGPAAGGQGLWRNAPAKDGTTALTVELFSTLAQQVNPAVVSIFTTQLRHGGRDIGLPLIPFRLRVPAKVRGRSLGSGFLVHPNGYILTSDHVVAEAESIKVMLKDVKEPVEASVVARDPSREVALLKVASPKPLPTLALGDSDRVGIGEMVMAVGNPLGLSHTVTAGIISAKGRVIDEKAQRSYELLQTDASINPGNSGGPLIDMKGGVIGINTAIATRAQGIGFAVPINVAKEFLARLPEP
jgi:serine protease Do